MVVTMDGPPIENGALAISGDQIVDVGKFPEVSQRQSNQEIVDLGDQVLLPGLINAHCHLDYTCLRGKIPSHQPFADWIRAINDEKARLSPKDYVRSINQGFAEAEKFGTTTIANLTAFPELIGQINEPIRTWWFAELIDVRDPKRAKEIVDLAEEQLKSKEHWGLAPHAPFTASADLYRRCGEVAEREKILLTTHSAESREEMSMFRDGKGPLYLFVKGIGRDMSDCGKGTPVEWLMQRASPGRTGTGNRPSLLVHLNELEENDFDLLVKPAKDLSIVYCPRSHDYFGHSPFQFEKLRERDFNVCLGTDSLASNEDLSLFAEMRAFQKEFPNASSEEILEMVTTNSARALRQQDRLGKIRSGFEADLIALPYERSTSAFDAIIAHNHSVSWSMLAGRDQAA
ncbi:MAG: amidohydrolase family protein [Verrucomicrobia bacterium]|nr:amidohydrolase family protein [Verrucomicrobiota bacterium]